MNVIVFIWGFTGILGKIIQLNFDQIVFFRLILSGLSLFLYLALTRKNYIIRDKKSAIKVFGIGILVTLHWLLFYKAIQVSSASLAVLCLATTTLHVSWIEPIVMKQKFSIQEFIFGLLVIAGIAFVSGNIDATQLEGVFWGLCAAVTAACFSVFNLKMKRKGISSSSITLYEMFSGFFFLVIILGFQGKFDSHFFQMTMSDFWWLMFLSVICTSIAYLLMIEVVDKLGAFTASLSINLEPVYSILLAIPILHENEILNSKFYFGAAFIVLVIIMNPIVKNWMEKKGNKSSLIS
ncbi:MAG: DMT family transporter [Brumimicrobium sp.]|nr:DMT family transporter [Brumimicrobium sp.]